MIVPLNRSYPCPCYPVSAADIEKKPLTPFFDDLVKSKFRPVLVIPEKAGIQLFKHVMDSRLRGNDRLGDFYEPIIFFLEKIQFCIDKSFHSVYKPSAKDGRLPMGSVFTSHEDVERKTLMILRILHEAGGPLGSRILARKMQERGFMPSERAVRYHLKLMDERGLTRLVGRRDGRAITDMGIDELDDARVQDKLGFVISRIESLAFRTTFDPIKCRGFLPMNITLFPSDRFGEALDAMKPAFNAGICVSDLVSVSRENERLGETIVPKGKIALATVCSIVINGVLLKAGVPMDSKFGGILQVKNGKPLRFAEFIYYSGTSLDPSEAFIRAKMTSVREVSEKGEGKILANFREVPAICRSVVEKILPKLKSAGISGVMTTGEASEPICQVPVDVNKLGVILIGGLNPVACAQEAGIEGETRAMSSIMEYQELRKFSEVCREKW